MSGGAFSVATKRLVIRRQDGACAVCQRIVIDTLDNTPLAAHEFHHRLPRRSGGRFGQMAKVCASPANALLLCQPHHAEIERYDRTTALGFGWLVREGTLPADCPVFHLGEWVRLDDLGNYLPVHGSDPYNGAPR